MEIEINVKKPNILSRMFKRPKKILAENKEAKCNFRPNDNKKKLHNMIKKT